MARGTGRAIHVVQTDKAGPPAGPYSQGIRAGGFVFMTDLGEFHKMNAIYAEYFTASPPGRTTVEVKGLPAGAHVEITATALAGDGS